jgi:hypothetical protein
MRTPLDLAVEYEEEEAGAVLRAHGARHSLHIAAREGMPDEVAAGIASGQDVNACDQVIFLCVFVDGWVGGIYMYLYTHTHTHTQTHVSFLFFPFDNIYFS